MTTENGEFGPKATIWGPLIDLEYGECSVPASALARAANSQMAHSIGDYLIDVNKGYTVNPSAVTYPKTFVARDTFVREEPLYVIELPETGIIEIPAEHRPSYDSSFRVINKTDQPDERIENERESKPHTFALVSGLSKHTSIEKVSTKLEERFNTASLTFDWTNVWESQTRYEMKQDGFVWLADRLIGGKVLLPILTFDPQVSGNCSWVQIGQEISDDAYVIGSADEAVFNRRDLLEQFRLIVAGTRKFSETVTLAHEFADRERQRQVESLNVALGAYLCQVMGEQMESKADQLPNGAGVIKINDDDHLVMTKDGLSRLTFEKSEINLGIIRFHVEAYSPTNGGSNNDLISICGVARGNVAIPILDCDTATGEVSFHDNGIGLSDEEKYGILLGLISYVDPSAIEDFVRLAGNNKVNEFITEKFSLQDRLYEMLEPACEHQEQLAHLLGGLILGQFYKGVLKDQKVGQSTDDIAGRVRLLRPNHTTKELSAEFYIRTLSLPEGRSAKPNITYVYDPTKPLKNALPDTDFASQFCELISVVDRE